MVVKYSQDSEWNCKRPGLFCTQATQEPYARLTVLVHGSFHVLIIQRIPEVQQKLQEKKKDRGVVVLRGPNSCYSRNAWFTLLSLCACIFLYSWSAQLEPSQKHQSCLGIVTAIFQQNYSWFWKMILKFLILKNELGTHLVGRGFGQRLRKMEFTSQVQHRAPAWT